MKSPRRVCEVAGCERPYKCRGLCGSHYYRRWKGLALAAVPIGGMKRGPAPPLAEEAITARLLHYSMPNKEHLIWCGVLNSCGHGRVCINGKRILAHRLVWEITYGPIPDGLQVNHLCDTPPCITPEHLYLGTQSNNLYDGEKRHRDQGVAA